MQISVINGKLNRSALDEIASYLTFPAGEPITALDLRCGNGRTLEGITSKHEGEKYLYGAEHNVHEYQRAKEKFFKVCQSSPISPGKITDRAFSLAVVDAPISRTIKEQVLESLESFKEPDFYQEEKRRLQLIEQQKQGIDFGMLPLEEEAAAVEKEKMEEELLKRVKERRLAFRLAIREQEKALSFKRLDKNMLEKSSNKLMPGGVLVMITPKELIDQTITMRLASHFEDIQIYRLPEPIFAETRKCVILARRVKKAKEDYRKEGYKLAEYKFKPYTSIPVIGNDINGFSLEVPSQSDDAVLHFRVGPITPQEAADHLKRSSLLETYQQKYTNNTIKETPTSPTPLHKGHIMLLLTSGSLNGYIGKGENQHLVKGTAVKRVREFPEFNEEDGTTIIKHRDYFKISVKLLNRLGEFKTLM